MAMTTLDLKKHQIDKVNRLLIKARENDTVTVKKDQDQKIYFVTILRYFEQPDCSGSIRLEALGSAVANAVAAAHLLVASGVAEIKKVKSKEKLVTYEGEHGHQS